MKRYTKHRLLQRAMASMPLLYLLITLFPSKSFTQNVLTLREAVDIVTTQNNDVILQQMLAEATSMQVYRSNAGFGPIIDWNVNFGSSFNNVNQEFFDGRNINRFGRAVSPNTNLSLSWTLFDGKRRATQYQILQEQSEIGQMQVEQLKEMLINEVSIAYLNMAKQKENISFLKNIIKYYEERSTITEQRWEIGRGSKLDFLQSQNDLNAQLTTLQEAEIVLANQKVLFNLLLNRDPEIEFDTEEITRGVESYNMTALLDLGINNNDNLKLLDKDLGLNMLQVKLLESNEHPRIGFTSALGYSLSNTNAGLILLNQNLGINIGFSSVLNIYDGKHNKRQTEITKYRNNIIARQKELTTDRIRAEVVVALNQWNSYKRVYDIEEKNKALAEENLEISLEKFRLGSSTILEVNEAQQRYDDAVFRFVNSFYNIKFSEVEFERIMR